MLDFGVILRVIVRDGCRMFARKTLTRMLFAPRLFSQMDVSPMSTNSQKPYAQKPFPRIDNATIVDPLKICYAVLKLCLYVGLIG